MITVQANAETGDAQIHYDDETVQGHYIDMRVDDENGLGLLYDLFKFYQAKGYNPELNLLTPKPGLLQRLAQFFRRP